MTTRESLWTPQELADLLGVSVAWVEDCALRELLPSLLRVDATSIFISADQIPLWEAAAKRLHREEQNDRAS